MTYLPIAIRIVDLWVRKGGSLFFGQSKSILQDINFEVQSGEFVAVVGPNGAGKTTLLKAMVGDMPAHGQIQYKQADQPFESLYDNPEYWLQRVGYVPVDNVLHDDLTVRQVLMLVGQLRLPEQTLDWIANKVVQTLTKFGFSPEDSRLDQPVKTLSSGEKKKINIAAELLTDPPLLLLDEPTSNLDPNAERDLMDNLRALSGARNQGDGPTILIITHTLQSLDRCDRVAFIANSRLIAYGSVTSVYEQLKAEVPLFKRPANPDAAPFEHWASIFDHHQTNEEVAQRRTRVPAQTDKTYSVAQPRKCKEDNTLRQFQILFKRYFLLRFNDLNGIFAVLLSGFIAGFLLLIAPSDVFLKAPDASAARQTVVLYTILVVIMGVFTSHREVSKEFRIYTHERTKGLDPLAYLMAKMVWMGSVIGILVTAIVLSLTGFLLARIFTLVVGLVIGLSIFYTAFVAKHMTKSTRLQRIFQGVLLASPLVGSTFIQLQMKALPDFPIDPTAVELVITASLIFSSLAALMLGLFVSAAVGGNNDRATQLAIAVILINVVLAFSALVIAGRDFQQLFDTLEPFAATHWGYRGFASGISLYCWAGQTPFENYNSWGHILATWLMLIVHVSVLLTLTVLALRLQETWLTRTRLLRSIVRSQGAYFAIMLTAALLSWSVFMLDRSYEYYQLTFFDRLFGANRYARIETQPDADSWQILNGVLSQSECGLPDANRFADR